MIEGPGFHKIAAPLDYIPVFVREGASVPMLTVDVQHLKDPMTLKHTTLWPLSLDASRSTKKPAPARNP